MRGDYGVNNLENLKQEYDNSRYLYSKLCDEVYHQIKELVKQNDIKLAVPIEHRVKELSSVIQKYERYDNIKNLSDINDLAGVRIITVFEIDISKICKIIETTFDIQRKEDTSKRLKENQFGYGSIHYEVTLKEDWCNIPSLFGLNGLKIEIQVRTSAQHLWAISSHILQYKKEKYVPDNVKRSINRVAALLELVDLEFLRVLKEQKEYISDITHEENIEHQLLNIENLKYILKSKLPKANEDITDPYSELIDNLYDSGITTTTELVEFIKENYDLMIEAEKKAMRDIREDTDDCDYNVNMERFEKGVFYTFVGLIREGLREKFGKEFYHNAVETQLLEEKEETDIA